ncbi:histone-lysine N-methyltransferase ATXR3 [Brassica rapa]|uniref:SET domain-containing protein n=1 Tax=Brassica campestris TaxID=3711 RepID=M4F7M5_BRACM|nr:histone-lysine N-methyltransferase ATXR3 [Brassica rapa]XP_009144718.1 histone-lysine N-methyltransferase ATXR3 [Brassica rapa]
MSDGGVACMPLLNIMEKLPAVEKTLCGGNNDTKLAANSENGHASISANDDKLPDSQPAQPPKKKKKKIVKKVIRKVMVRKQKQPKQQAVQLPGESQAQTKEHDKKSEPLHENTCNGQLENGGDSGFKDEVEEGELGTMSSHGVLENGEISPVKSLQRSEIEKGEISGEGWKKDETANAEFSYMHYDKGYAERRDLSSDKYRKGEERDFRSWRDPGDEIEKGEFIPDRWHKMDTVRDDHSYNRSRRNGSDREKTWRYEYDYEHERTPPGGRFVNEDFYRRREFRSGNDRTTRISSKIVIEDNLHKNEYNDPNGLGKEYSSTVNKLKRHGAEPDSFERKHSYDDYGDYGSSKCRKISDDYSRSLHSDHYSRHSAERPYKDSYSSKTSSLEKYSRKHQDSSFPARAFSDRHGHSPARSDLSPHDRSRYHEHRDRSPLHRERSPYARERSPYIFEKSSHARKRSPHDRSHHHDYRRSPSYSEWSSDRRDGTSNYREDPQSDRNRRNGHREISRKSGVREKGDSQAGTELEHKYRHRDSNGKESASSSKELQGQNILYNNDPVVEKSSICDSSKIPSPCAKGNESVQVSEAPTEELPSMEVDMDICDTPPHEPAKGKESVAADSSLGKWFYLDYYGMENGPAKLSELKALMEQGILFSDHMIKHSDNNRWVTIENATSPTVNLNFPSVVSDAVTRLVNPPEAPGNLLEDIVDAAEAVPMDQEAGYSLPESVSIPDTKEILVEHHEDFQFDKRIASLVEGCTITPGRELETLGEAMQIEVEREETRKFVSPEDITWCYYQVVDQLLGDEASGSSEPKTRDVEELTSENVDGSERDEIGSWLSGRWSCKGGDWIRRDEASQDIYYKKKLVLNDGFPLCLMQKSGHEDPRRHQKDDLYYSRSSSRLELPLWAFSGVDERNQARGVKANVLSVVRLNSLVVNDQVPSIPDPHVKVRGREKCSSRHARPSPASSDSKWESVETISQSTSCGSQDLQGCWKTGASANTPTDRLYTVEDLQLHLGDWFYIDGAGQEQGPLPFSALQILVDKGLIKSHSSVFRKSDKIWVPVTSITKTLETSAKLQGKKPALPSDCQSLVVSESQDFKHSEMDTSLSSFHSMHPQFLGYFRGKLHQLVMKTFKSREFSAAINDVLDTWINGKQSKKETDKYMYHSSEFDLSYPKRARLMAGESGDHSEVDDVFQKDELAFEDLCGDATFHVEGSGSSRTAGIYWDLLDGHALARVFHLLRYDVKSLAFASMTCRHWKATVNSYKDISRQVDLSSLGPNCTDSRLWSIMNTYNTQKIDSVILVGCTNVTSSMLEEVLRLFPHISSVNITGCSQFGDLTLNYKKVSWLKFQHPRSGELRSRLRSLKQATDVAKSKGLGGDTDDFGNLKDYFDRVEKRDSANQLFRKSLYKRSKLYDARKSSAILSRDARIRRWAVKKSEHGYKRVEEFLASSLRGIMKQNTFDFFTLKVAQIEEKMKNGYYVSHGLKSVKEDISRMCREAIKGRNRGGSKDMNRIIVPFIQLATRLEEVSMVTSSYRRDELMKSWQDGSGFSSASKYNKKLSKSVTEKKFMSRTSDTLGVNGALDYGEYASDREIRRRLSKLNRKSFGSGSETSSELSENDSYSSASASESESDIRSEGRSQDSRVEKYFTSDESFDSVIEEREWGARMTKAGLVPPVTRKYEVIEKYTIVADEEEVQRKMRVSLPEDYAEKLKAQKNGTEELDMELPEVKEYKPRKLLGNEVLEQEVYGIDPYTHNLLLDSMPELDWSLQDKHSFIEDVVLRTLNRQARLFTGSGNTPMVFPLRPVIEELKENAREECDIQTMRMCQGILKAIESRSDDNYVSYRKGLGVVCNKQSGFVVEDFVVEFLGEVYPVWKWFEKQDGIRSLQENKTDPAPEFYNIYLERPKGDADGYDLVVVDAMHKANYASRICHSCRPNCEAKVTAVDGHYQIGIYSVRPIEYGEEITFDYNSVTESKEEYEASVCLCGSQVCRGSYLNLTGEGAFQKVLKEWHGLLDRHKLMLEACILNSVSEEDYLELGRAGLGSCLLGGLPDWVIAYTARLVRFINFERTKLPEEILKHNMEEKRKYFSDVHLDVEKSDAEVQAEGVYNQRLQNLAVTLDKVRYVMRRVFGDPKNAPPPLERLTPEETVSLLWNGDGSLVEELLQCLSPHVEEGIVDELRYKIRAHDPSGSADVLEELQRSLLWLRDEIRDLPCTYKCRNDAAADLIHIYAYTKCFFKVREYKSFVSSPVHISPLDLGAKYAEKLGDSMKEYRKTYGENYCLGQLIYWYEQTNTDPDVTLVKATRGCLSLPDVASFYAKAQKPSKHRVYGPKTVKTMVSQMLKQPQKPWAKDKIWMFKSNPGVFGSPMFDAVLNDSSLDRELLQWLRSRRHVFQATWDS